MATRKPQVLEIAPVAAAPFALPPLSESLSILMSLSVEERQNLRLLELLVSKDPVAVARLLALANSPMVSTKGAGHSLSQALQLLGSEATYVALVAIWAAEGIPCIDGFRPVRDYLVRHIFAICATMRRLTVYAQLENVDTVHLQMYALFSKVCLAFALTQEADPAAQQAVREAASHGRQLFLEHPDLQDTLEKSVLLASHWGAPAAVVQNLQQLVSRNQESIGYSEWTHLSLVSELLCDGAGSPESLEQLKALFETNPILVRLVERKIDPMSFVISR